MSGANTPSEIMMIENRSVFRTVHTDFVISLESGATPPSVTLANDVESQSFSMVLATSRRVPRVLATALKSSRDGESSRSDMTFEANLDIDATAARRGDAVIECKVWANAEVGYRPMSETQAP